MRAKKTTICAAALLLAMGCSSSKGGGGHIDELHSFRCPLEGSQTKTYPEKHLIYKMTSVPEKFTGYPRPEIAIQFGSGWLLGSNRGEFIGELVYMNKQGGRELLLKTNVINIFRQSFGYVVVNWVPHQLSSKTSVHVVKGEKDNTPSVELFGYLPREPKETCLYKNEKIFLRFDTSDYPFIQTGKRNEPALPDTIFLIEPTGKMVDVRKGEIVAPMDTSADVTTDVDEL